MSLRDLPTGQALRSDRWRRLRYIPLIALVVLSAVAAAIGVYVGANGGSL